MRRLPEQYVDKILIGAGIVGEPVRSGKITASIESLNFAIQSAFKIGLDYDLMQTTLKQGEDNHEHTKR